MKSKLKNIKKIPYLLKIGYNNKLVKFYQLSGIDISNLAINNIGNIKFIYFFLIF